MAPVKRYITILQMVQFAIILTHLAIHRLWYKCYYNDLFNVIFSSAVAVMFYTFYGFYKKSYGTSDQKIRAGKKS